MKKGKLTSSDELRKLRSIIGKILDLVENKLLKPEGFCEEEYADEQLRFILGDRDNILSVICKLGNLLVKIDRLIGESEEDGEVELGRDDILILRRFFADGEGFGEDAGECGENVEEGK